MNGTVCSKRAFGLFALTGAAAPIKPRGKSSHRPMPSYPVNLSASTPLDGAGNGTVSLAPRLGQTWRLTVAAVKTSTSVAVPSCSIYVGGQAIDSNFVDGTFTGNLDSTGRVSDYPIQHGQKIFAVWTGGDPGAVATLSILGMQDNG